MSVFAVPDVATGPPGPPGVPGVPGSATSGGYGSIFLADGSFAQAFTAAAGYEKFTGFASSGLSDGNVVLAPGSDLITVNEAGTWRIFFQISYFTSATGGNIFASIFKNGSTRIPEITAGDTYRISAQTTSVATWNVVTLAAGDDLELHVDVTLDTTLTFSQVQLMVERIAA